MKKPPGTRCDLCGQWFWGWPEQSYCPTCQLLENVCQGEVTTKGQAWRKRKRIYGLCKSLEERGYED